MLQPGQHAPIPPIGTLAFLHRHIPASMGHMLPIIECRVTITGLMMIAVDLFEKDSFRSIKGIIGFVSPTKSKVRNQNNKAKSNHHYLHRHIEYYLHFKFLVLETHYLQKTNFMHSSAVKNSLTYLKKFPFSSFYILIGAPFPWNSSK